MKILFSIVIFTKDSIGVIERLVDSLLNQKFDHEYEVIFMDNSSKDSTVDYLKKSKFKNKKIINVPAGEFSHSRTRMRAAEIAKGEYLIFFTDDIIPIGESFLLELTKPVLENQALASYGVYQINSEACDPVDAYLHNGWYKDFDDITEPISKFCWNKFPPELRRRLCNFDNCSSCINREMLLNLKFPDVPYGEDMLFAKKMILNNQSIAISKKAKFYHWHKVSFSYLMKRMCIDQYLSIDELGIYYVRRKLGVLKAILIRVIQRTFIAFFKLKIPLRKKIYWSFYNAKTLTADFLGKYMGILDKDSVNKGFSPINKKLIKKKDKIISEIYKKSIMRY
jgi:rhamnosyltransferase